MDISSRNVGVHQQKLGYINWWYTYPSEKYESQLGLLFPIYGKIKNDPNHQPVNKPLIRNWTTVIWEVTSILSLWTVAVTQLQKLQGSSATTSGFLNRNCVVTQHHTTELEYNHQTEYTLCLLNIAMEAMAHLTRWSMMIYLPIDFMVIV